MCYSHVLQFLAKKVNNYRYLNDFNTLDLVGLLSRFPSQLILSDFLFGRNIPDQYVGWFGAFRLLKLAVRDFTEPDRGLDSGNQGLRWRVTSDCLNLWNGRADDGKPRHSRSGNVVEGDAYDAGGRTSLAPHDPVPWHAVAVAKDPACPCSAGWDSVEKHEEPGCRSSYLPEKSPGIEIGDQDAGNSRFADLHIRPPHRVRCGISAGY